MLINKENKENLWPKLIHVQIFLLFCRLNCCYGNNNNNVVRKTLLKVKEKDFNREKY